MDIEDRLENWARAVRFRNRAGHAMSFEGNYRSPQRNHWEIPVTAIRGNINPDDAWQVEAAWSTLTKPRRILLRCHYCIRWNAQRICRFLGREADTLIKPYEYDGFRLECVGAIALALARSEVQNRNIVRTTVKESLALPRSLAYNAD